MSGWIHLSYVLTLYMRSFRILLGDMTFALSIVKGLSIASTGHTKLINFFPQKVTAYIYQYLAFDVTSKE